MRSLLFICLCLLSILGTAQHKLIPNPVEYKVGSESFTMDKQLNIVLGPQDGFTTKLVLRFAEELKQKGFNVKVSKGDFGSAEKAIYFGLNKINDALLGAEGYELKINKSAINIKANQPAGLLHGVQTLKQLFPPGYFEPNFSVKRSMDVPGGLVRDYPRFEWRGLMLDVSRHFFTIEGSESLFGCHGGI